MSNSAFGTDEVYDRLARVVVIPKEDRYSVLSIIEDAIFRAYNDGLKDAEGMKS